MKRIAIDTIFAYLHTHNYQYRSCVKKENMILKGYSSLVEYKSETVTWVKNHNMIKNLDLSKITLIIAEEGVENIECDVIYVKNSKAAFFGIIEDLFEYEERRMLIGKNTYISEKVSIGEKVQIGSNCVIDGNIKIGDRTTIMDGTVIINNCEIGCDTIIQPLCVIGIDGFGYYEDEERNKIMIKHYGGVKIGNNVFVGSHTNIARGTLGNTIIDDGVKIAPSTHIGHNNYVDKNATIICSNVYGSCYIGRESYITACTIKNQTKVGPSSLSFRIWNSS